MYYHDTMAEKEMLQGNTVLMELKLPTLKYRRIRGNMIEVYKLLTNTYDDNTFQLDTNSDTRTRGHTMKLDVRIEMPI